MFIACRPVPQPAAKVTPDMSGSYHKYHFCCDKSFVVTNTCLTNIFLSRQIFVATNTFLSAYFCRNKHMFVATCFVATNIILSRQAYFCRNKRRVFVATKMILVAAFASDTYQTGRNTTHPKIITSKNYKLIHALRMIHETCHFMFEENQKEKRERKKKRKKTEKKSRKKKAEKKSKRIRRRKKKLKMNQKDPRN